MSRIALGCGNFGGIGSAPELFGQGESREEAFALMDAAWAAGINVFDTAASYGGGRSESWVGAWRSERKAPVLLSTKVFWSVTGDPDDRGLGHERILRELDGSLGRLGTERVDLYLTHEPDEDTPIEETLRALDEIVRAGKAGAIGASNLDGAGLEEALETSTRLGLARYGWVQNEYSLLRREAEREILPICEREGLGFTPFSPLAGGWLTGKYRRGEAYPSGSRMTLRPDPYEDLVNDETFDGLEAVRGRGRRPRRRARDPRGGVGARPPAGDVGGRRPSAAGAARDRRRRDRARADARAQRDELAGLFA